MQHDVDVVVQHRSAICKIHVFRNDYTWPPMPAVNTSLVKALHMPRSRRITAYPEQHLGVPVSEAHRTILSAMNETSYGFVRR